MDEKSHWEKRPKVAKFVGHQNIDTQKERPKVAKFVGHQNIDTHNVRD
jgi:hypothetical protein